MKKMNLLVMIGLFSLSTMVKAGLPDYIITGEGIKFYEKVRCDLTANLVGIDDSGRFQYKADEVLAYRKDGRIYERMPVIKNNRETGRHAFMELIAYRNGLKVYRHYKGSGFNTPNQQKYLVFQGSNYLVHFDQRNSKTLNSFFFRSEHSFASNLFIKDAL